MAFMKIDRICSFMQKNSTGIRVSQYFLSKGTEKAGSGWKEKGIYMLKRQIFPSKTTIEIRIDENTASSLAELSDKDGIAQCEKLISAVFCKRCKARQSREPPGCAPLTEDDK